MIVWQTQVEGVCGPCVWKDLDAALLECLELKEDLVDDKASFTITPVEMTEEEFENLPEFAGY